MSHIFTLLSTPQLNTLVSSAQHSPETLPLCALGALATCTLLPTSWTMISESRHTNRPVKAKKKPNKTTPQKSQQDKSKDAKKPHAHTSIPAPTSNISHTPRLPLHNLHSVYMALQTRHERLREHTFHFCGVQRAGAFSCSGERMHEGIEVTLSRCWVSWASWEM